MGERGAANEPATPDDIAAMAAIVQEAVEAGALGFSTSRTLGHRAMDGEPVPGTFAAEDELFGLGRAMADGRPRGVRARADGRRGRGPRRARAARSTGCAGSPPRSSVPVSFALAAGRRRARPLARADGRVAPRDRRRRAGRTRRSRPARSGCCSASRAATRSAAARRTAGSPTSLPRDELARRAGASPTCAARSSPRTTSPPDPTALFDGLGRARAGVARPHLLAGRPARLRADAPTAPIAAHRRGGRASTRWPCSTTCMLEHDGAAPAHAAVLQLRRRATTTRSARCCSTRRACSACPTVARTAG